MLRANSLQDTPKGENGKLSPKPSGHRVTFSQQDLVFMDEEDMDYDSMSRTSDAEPTPARHAAPDDAASFTIDTDFDIHKEAHQRYLKRQRDGTENEPSTSLHAAGTQKRRNSILDPKVDEDAITSPETDTPPAQKSLRNCFGFLPWLYSTRIFKLLFPAKLGIITGVIVPIMLNTFGVILFLRLGQIVGKTGLLWTVAMFSLSYFALALTILSLAAIATNGKIRGGGVYFMISRVLGPEWGAGIGTIFFAGNIAGGAMYILGFVEAFSALSPALQFGSHTLVYSSALLFLLCLVVMMGASIFSKTTLLSIFILFVVIISMIVTFIFQSPGAGSGAYTGWRVDSLKTNLFANYGTQSALALLQMYFGILFPATTGALSGANLSGDLKNVARDLPRGTLLSICVTYLVYVGLSFIIAFTMNNTSITNNSNVMTLISLVPPLMTVGIFTSTIGAGLMSIIGATRIVQALGKDKLLPLVGIVGKGFGKNQEPRLAVVLTWILLQLVLFIGNLNAVAPFVSLFYLLAYLLINLSCFALAVTDAPNFRPSFKYFNKWTALLGCIFNVAFMFFINPLYASITFLLMVLIMLFTHFYAPPKHWGSIARAIIYSQTRKFIIKLDDRDSENLKYWRLKALVMCSSPRSNYDLLSFIDSITKHRGGIAICGHVDTRDFRTHLEHHRRENEYYYRLAKLSKWNMFTTRVHGADIREGARNLLTTSGSPFATPNTLMLGFYDDELPQQRLINTCTKRGKKIQKALSAFPPLRTTDRHGLDLDEYMEILKDAFLLKKNIVISRHFNKLSQSELAPASYLGRLVHKKDHNIDVWMLCFNENNNEIEATLSLMLQMAYLVKCSNVWRKYHRLRVFVLIDQTADYKTEKKRIKKLLELARINAKPIVVQLTDKDFDILESDPNTKIKFEKIGRDTSEYRICLNEEKSTTEDGKDDKKTLLSEHLHQTLDSDSVIIRIEDDAAVQHINGVSGPSPKPLVSSMRKAKTDGSESTEAAPLDIELKQSGGMTSSRSVQFAPLASSVLSSTKKMNQISSSSSLTQSTSDAKLSVKRGTKHRRSASMPSFGMMKTSASIDFLSRSFSIGDVQLTFPGQVHIYRSSGQVLSELEKHRVLNHIIRSHSQQTNVILLSMPPPPVHFTPATHQEYHENLRVLTEDLPPTMLIYGTEQTISVDWD